jgi:hypothetical protein
MLPRIRKSIKATIARFFSQGATANELIALIKEIAAERSGAGYGVSRDHSIVAPGGEPEAIAVLPKAAERMPPARTARGLSAILSTQKTIKDGFIFIAKTSDGRPWGSVCYHELAGMRRDGTIARRIMDMIGTPMDQFASIDNLLTDAQFREIYDAEATERAAPVQSRRGRDAIDRAGRAAPAIHEGTHSRHERR